MSYLESGKKVLRKIEDNGFEAFFVGGVVRDYLLKQPFHDIDITTNAKPNDLKKIFEKVYDKGIKYNSVLIILDGFQYEVTTYRLDINYIDFRHPIIKDASSLKEDLARRDFTINAMAMNSSYEIFDYFNGKKDLSDGIIRTVGDPLKRFTEDALRMLRACYFTAKLGFVLDNKTLDAIKQNKSLINKISSERVFQEISKLLASKYPLQGLKVLHDTGLDKVIPTLFDAVNICLDKGVTVNDPILFFSLASLKKMELDAYYKVSNSFKTKVKMSLELYEVTHNGDYNKLLLYSYGKEISLYANALNCIMGYHKDLSRNIVIDYENLPIKKTCDLVFKGQDIMSLTNKTSASWIGDMVEDIKYAVIMGELKNDYEAIKSFVERKLSK